jgi:hypothetical protein
MITIAAVVIALVFWPVTLCVLAVIYWPITLVVLVLLGLGSAVKAVS